MSFLIEGQSLTAQVFSVVRWHFYWHIYLLGLKHFRLYSLDCATKGTLSSYSRWSWCFSSRWVVQSMVMTMMPHGLHQDEVQRHTMTFSNNKKKTSKVLSPTLLTLIGFVLVVQWYVTIFVDHNSHHMLRSGDGPASLCESLQQHHYQKQMLTIPRIVDTKNHSVITLTLDWVSINPGFNNDNDDVM